MRWELIKLFRVPVDDDIIKNTNKAQMLWYANMFNQDREVNFENKRNMTEYLASFINGAAVQEVRDGREHKKTITDGNFEQILRDNFGRDLSPEILAQATRAETEDAPKSEIKKKGSISIDDIKKYTGMKLDDVRFIPNKK